jgi:hypothetical protein
LYDALYDGGPDAMPNLSALARRALVFENAYAVYPESIKGLFSVLCSTFPAFDSRPEIYESVECRSLPAVLSDAGYRTAMFHSGRFGYLGMESIIRHRGYQTLEDAGSISGNHNSSFGVDEPATVDHMLAWIDALPPGHPFFLTYLPIAGHHPYVTPERGPFPVTAEVDQYRNALHYGDASLGALIEGLRARGLEENTVWVVYGDHGEAFGQHQGNYGHTFLLYDENVRVPFVIAAPGRMRAQERVRKVVSLVDIAPTILALLGIPPPSNYQGASMLDSAPRMALFFADYSLGLLGLRDGAWKFVYELESGRAKLFDLERDPRRRQIYRRARQRGHRGMARRCAAGAARRSAISGQTLRLAETVSQASLGEQIFGGGGIVLQPVAQLVDEGTQVFDLSAILGTPYRAQKARMRQWNAGVRHQVMQQLEGLGSEVHGAGRFAHDTAGRVELNVADSDRRRHIGKRGLRTADGRAKTRRQFGDRERLGDEIVGSGIERPHLVALAVANRQHQNLQTGSHAAELPACLNSSDTGHIDVQQNGVEAAAFHALQGLLAVGRSLISKPSACSVRLSARRRSGSSSVIRMLPCDVINCLA